MKAPEESDPKCGEGFDPEFLAEFQKAIEAYTKATEAGKPEEAEQAAMAALMMAGMNAIKHPTPEGELGMEASSCEAAGDWAGAELAFLKLLELRQQMGILGMIAKTLMDLSRLYHHTQKSDLASKYAHAATAAAKKSEISPLIVMALECETAAALARGDVTSAVRASGEALEVIEPGKLNDLMRARALATHAQCILESGDADAAEKQLNRALAILTAPTTSKNMLGPVVALAKCNEVQAMLELKRGTPQSAAKALVAAIEFRRRALEVTPEASPYLLAALARTLERWAAVCAQLGDSVAGSEGAKEAKTLYEQAHLPAKSA